MVTDFALSDHYCVLFIMATPANLIKGKLRVIKKCYIIDNTCTLFTQVFTPSPPLTLSSVDDLVNSFSSNVMTVIDFIAPIRTILITAQKKSMQTGTT